MMLKQDGPRVAALIARELGERPENIVFREPDGIPMVKSAIDGTPVHLSDGDKGKLGAIGVMVWGDAHLTGAVVLEGVALEAVQRGVDTESQGAQPIGVGVEIGTGLQHVPVVVLGPDDAQALLALRVYRRMGERLPLTVQRLAGEGSSRPRTALEETRDSEEQKALAMIRDRRREGESEPDTLKRLLVDIDEWPTVRRLLRETSLRGEGLAETAHRLTLGPAFQPALDASTPEIVQRCAGLPMFQAAAQLAHYIRFEVPKLKGAALAPSAPASEWMRAFCMRHHPAYQGDPIYQGDLIAWVMATMRKLAAERDNLQALATLREGCATAWGKAVDLLAPLAEELDDNLGHEGPLDVLHRVLAQRAEAEEHDLEAVPRIDVTSPMEQVVVDKTSPPITLETPRDVVRFLNRRLGLDFDTCEDVAAYIERVIKPQRAANPIGGDRTWRGMPGESGPHRLYHDDTGALCYEGPGTKLLDNNRAHPYPGERGVLFSDHALAAIASIVNIARAAERALQHQERAGIERELHNLKSPFIPVGHGAGNPFIAHLAGKRMDQVVGALAGRVLDTDAAAGALLALYPGRVMSYPGLADCAVEEIKRRRAEREETEGALGRIAAMVGIERQASPDIIEREVGQALNSARENRKELLLSLGSEAEARVFAQRALAQKQDELTQARANIRRLYVPLAPELKAAAVARIKAAAPHGYDRSATDLIADLAPVIEMELDRALGCEVLDEAAGKRDAEGPGGSGGVILISAKVIKGVTISASGGADPTSAIAKPAP